MYDVWFWKREDLQTCLVREKKTGSEKLEGITFLSSEINLCLFEMVYLYNHFVRDEEIKVFLLRYCDSLFAQTKLTNVRYL